MTDTDEIRRKRRTLIDAMHNMHHDQRIKVDLDLAKALSRAWDEYDQAIRDDEFDRIRGSVPR